MPDKISASGRLLYPFVFYCLLIAIIVDRAYILSTFSFHYTDMDQAVEWAATHDIANGRFYEPCFYGQAYSPLVESAFAAPIYLAGVPIFKAAPIATAILGLFPYIFLAFAFKRSGKPFAALASLAMPFIFPVEMAAILSMPRGFTGGIAISTLGCFAALYKPHRNAGFFLFTALGIIGYTVCPNAAFLVFPIGVYLFLENWKNRDLYLFSFLGALIGVVLPLVIYYFYYVLHPGYVVHPSPGLVWHWDKFLSGFVISDLMLKFIILKGTDKMLMFGLAVAAYAGIFLYRKMPAKAVAVISLLILVAVSFAIDKVHDGRPGLFLPYSRMFLSIPVSFIFFTAWAERWTGAQRPSLASGKIILLFSVTLIFFLLRMKGYKEIITLGDRGDEIEVKTLDNVNYICGEIQRRYDKENIDMVIMDHWDALSTYASHSLGYTWEGIYPGYERRNGYLNKVRDRVYDRVMIFGPHTEIADRARELGIFIKLSEGSENHIIVSGKDRTLEELLKALKINFRRSALNGEYR